MSDLPSSPSDAAAADSVARVGLRAGERYRCSGCGNVTRFDVEVTERSRRFWHADLAGGGSVESEQRETTVHEVRCRWCGSVDVAVEPRPAAGGGTPSGTAEDAGST